MKKRMFERGLSLLLAFVMVLALAPVFTIEAKADNARVVTTFAELQNALADAANGTGSKNIELGANITATASFDVPSNVILTIPSQYKFVLPYGLNKESDSESEFPSANTKDYNGEDSLSNTISLPDNTSKCYLTVNILEKAKLIVDGTLVIGGEYDSGGSYYSGQTAGAFSKIDLADNSLIEVNGTLSCYGYITGTGLVNVTEDGTVYEPMILTNYGGGRYTKSAKDKISPFTSYAIINIQAPMSFVYGAELNVYGTVNASSMNFNAVAKILGTTDALFNMQQGCEVKFYHDATANAVASRKGIGRTTIEVDGDLSFGSLQLNVSVASIDSTKFDCPLSYNFSVIQKSGILSIPHKLKIMPGAEVYIEENASMIVTSSLALMDGVVTDANSGVTSAQVKAAGLCERGRLVVEGTLTVEDTGAIGGKIETMGHGTLNLNGGYSVKIQESETKTNTLFGANITYRTYTFDAKLIFHENKYSQSVEWTTVGKATYYGVSGEKGIGDATAIGTWSTSPVVYDNPVDKSVTVTVPTVPTGSSVVYYTDSSLTTTTNAPTSDFTGVAYYRFCAHETWNGDSCATCGLPRYSVNGETVTYYHDAINAIAAAYDGDKMVVCDVQTDGVDTFTLTGLKSDMTVKIFLLDADYAPIAGYVPEAKTVN